MRFNYKTTFSDEFLEYTYYLAKNNRTVPAMESFILHFIPFIYTLFFIFKNSIPLSDLAFCIFDCLSNFLFFFCFFFHSILQYSFFVSVMHKIPMPLDINFKTLGVPHKTGVLIYKNVLFIRIFFSTLLLLCSFIYCTNSYL